MNHRINPLNCQERDWFVVATQPRKEALASSQLQNQGFYTFLATRWKTVRHGRRSRNVLAPLFPGYLFASFDAGPATMRAVNGTRGIRHLLTNGEHPSVLPHGFVEMLASTLNSDGTVSQQPYLKPGDKVECACGPFARQIGHLLSLDDRGRVRVLLDLLGTHIPVRVSVTDILPA
jgi:transcriptional antiterminator RfaH